MNELAELMGRSPAIESVRATLRRLVGPRSASHRLPAVLIQGETGTGKGLIARLLHRLGPRRDRAFVEVNCAAIPDTLLESELFGFERGAFTDARQSKPGLFQIAHRGTIFLDEIGLLPEELQAKLLKAIEERQVRRLGATRSEPADAWIISATNSDLLTAIRERGFRGDLYHRLAVMTLSLPPVRERGDDALLLAEHYLARACADYRLPARTLTPDARARILAHRWPGNVREIANTMERAALLSESLEVTGAVLELREAPVNPPAEPERTARGASLNDAMREHLQAVLAQTSGNISRSATILGITRNTLRSRVKKLGLDVAGAERAPLKAPIPTAARDTAAAAERPTPSDSHVAPRPPTIQWERRMIAALAVSLSCPPDAALFQLASTQHELVEKLKSFGARVEERSQVGIVALFGLEPTESAASRATHAAFAMLNAVERSPGGPGHDVTARFAVHSSHCLIGKGIEGTGMDPQDRQEIDTVLDRLIQSADRNTIVVDHAAAEFVQRRFELEAAGVIAGQGRIYRVTGPGRTGFEVGGRSLSPFVGRAHDLSALQTLLARAKEGRGQAVGIVGEPGVGKSRLLHEFRRILAEEKVTYLEGRCLSYGNTVPYLPIIDIVRGCFALAEADTSEMIGEKVRSGLAALDMDASEWAPYLLHLLSCGEGTESLAVLSPEAVKTQTLEALRRMCLATSLQRPVVFAVEDLHWIDRNSEDALSALAGSLAPRPALLLVTYRGGYQPPWLSRSYASQLALQPLASPDSLAVVHSIVPEQALPAVLKEAILSRAEGIPFFLEELARVVAEQQDLGSEIIVPATIRAALMARLDRLPVEDRELIQTASVIGKDVSLPILRAVSDLAAGELGRRLVRLQAAEFLNEKGLFPVPEYSFNHALTHEAAYASMPTTLRQALHARVVEAIEAMYPDALSEQVDQLAHHAFHGEVWDKAVTYLRRAGERALRSSANREASRFFEDALSALRRLPQTPSTLEQTVDVKLNLRDALWVLARLPEIQAHLQEAKAVANALGDRCREGWIACYLCQYFWSVVHLDAALQAGERALELAESLPNPALRAETSFYLGLVYLALGEAGRAAAIFSTNLQTLDQVVEAHRREFSSPRFAANGPILVRGWMARVLAELGEFADAETWGRDAIRLGEAARSPFALTTALAGLGAAYIRKGQPEDAIPPLERGLELCRTYNFNNWLPTVAASLGAAYVNLGRIESGVALLEEAVDRGARAGIMSSYALWLIYLGEAYLQARRASDALAAVHRALVLCREHKERGYEAWALRLLAEIAASADPPDRDEAETRYQEALALAERLGMRPLVARCLLGLGRLYERVADPSGAERYLARGARLCRELGMPVATDGGGG